MTMDADTLGTNRLVLKKETKFCKSVKIAGRKALKNEMDKAIDTAKISDIVEGGPLFVWGFQGPLQLIFCCILSEAWRGEGVWAAVQNHAYAAYGVRRSKENTKGRIVVFAPITENSDSLHKAKKIELQL